MTDIPLKRDPRIERTHQLLSQALLDLILERGYDSITIQDITDRANVSRTTFYLHFKDKDELLFASMQKIYDGLVGSHTKQASVNLTPDDFETTECLSGDFDHVAEYADFYRVMLSKKGSIVFLLQVMSYLADLIETGLEEKLNGREPKIPPDMIAAFSAGAQIGVTKWWLENDMRYSPEEMTRMLLFLSLFGLNWACEREATTPKTNASQ